MLGGCGQDGSKSIDQEKVDDATDEIDEIEKLHDEATALYEAGKYREARNKMVRAYASFGLLKEKDPDARVRYLRLLCDIAASSS